MIDPLNPAHIVLDNQSTCSQSISWIVQKVCSSVKNFFQWIVSFFVRETHSDTLIETIKQHTNNSSLIVTLDKVKSVVAKTPIIVSHSYKHHALHDDLTTCTLAIKKEEKIQSIWKDFLKTIHNQKMIYPDATHVQIDCSREMDLLEGKEIKLTTETLDPKSESFNKDVQDISTLEVECYGKQKGSFEDLLQKLNSPTHRAIVVRDTTKKILGVLWYKIEDQFDATSTKYQIGPHSQLLHICSVGRVANAAKLKIGECLFSHLLQNFPESCDKAYLEVRENNQAAIALYKKFGFEPVATRSPYYSWPEESGTIMVCERSISGQKALRLHHDRRSKELDAPLSPPFPQGIDQTDGKKKSL